ncbi:hypothetical protein Z956_02950 [Clostridium botulinum D str. CCUG 7971]|nr:hypothetical protein Z956_02950 [Clostridium botulinum D str. CCUG 7971]
MITRDDSRSTYEYPNHYIVYPHFDWWNLQKYFTPGGKLIQEGFEYDSSTNKEWLSIEQLKNEIKKLHL